MNEMPLAPLFRQDLHVHTTWSEGDPAVVPEQTVERVAWLRHAETVGISDHFELLIRKGFEAYARAVRGAGLRLGTEVNGEAWVEAAASLPFDYYVYHCFDTEADYGGAERLLETGRPVIIAHPHMLDTDLARVPSGCAVEINNRYIIRCDWRAYYGPHTARFDFVLSSDAHQPHWLNQTVARRVAAELGVDERLLFPPEP
jgi:histidinol phosphatase-like PHP family hydrolase